MKTFETLLNFLSGISTFGWILLVAATVAFIIGTFLTISAFKRHKKKSKSGNLNIFSTAATTKELKRNQKNTVLLILCILKELTFVGSFYSKKTKNPCITLGFFILILLFFILLVLVSLMGKAAHHELVYLP